jgi:hypothetical protein
MGYQRGQQTEPDRGKWGGKQHVIADRDGSPPAFVLSAANQSAVYAPVNA